MAKKARNTLIVGSSWTCSNGGNGEDKHRNSMLPIEGKVSIMQLIHHGCE